MSEEFVVAINDDGGLQFIQNEKLNFLNELGTEHTERASHVEPDGFLLRWAFHIFRKIFGERGCMAAWTRCWPCLWRVNMKPSNGPILDGRWLDRQAALDSEVEWLKTWRI